MVRRPERPYYIRRPERPDYLRRPYYVQAWTTCGRPARAEPVVDAPPNSARRAILHKASIYLADVYGQVARKTEGL